MTTSNKSLIELLLILTGAGLGILVGLLFGHDMWLASGGPSARLDILSRTLEQKAEAIDAALAEEDVREARRLEEHLPKIRAERKRVENLAAETATKNLGGYLAAWQVIRILGDVFLRALMLVVIPLVFTSIVTGVTSLGDMRTLGRFGGWTLFYYLSTSGVAVIIGIVLVQSIGPGRNSDDTFAYVDPTIVEKGDRTVTDTLLEVVTGDPDEPGSGMIPKNLFRAASEGNVLALILFAIALGASLTLVGEVGETAVRFFLSLNEAVLRIVRWIIAIAPLGIFGLIASKIAEVGGAAGFGEEVTRLAWLVGTTTLGLFIHAVFLCIVLIVVGRRNPFTYIYQLTRALVTAMSTDSSSATLPVTIECVEEAGVSKESAGFVLPLGATMNMDGTALYEAVVAIFIAQSLGIALGPGAMVIIFLTATLAAIGAPGIPSAGLVTLIIVLTAVGLPASGIGTILAIDWFLDRERTTLNVFGDAVGAACIDRLRR